MEKTIDQSALTCPGCRSALERHGDDMKLPLLHCGACNKSYPIILGDLPVLLSNPDAALLGAYIGLERLISRLLYSQSAIHNITTKKLRRAAALAPVAGALQANVDYLRILQSFLAPSFRIETVLAELVRVSLGGPAAAPGYQNPFDFLRRDWSGLPECEQEIATVAEELAKVDTSTLPQPRSALVIGAGAGRYARIVAERFDVVYAVDRSLPLAMSYSYLQNNRLTFFEINHRNVFARDSLAVAVEVSVPPPKAGSGAVVYSVADVKALPFPSGSMSAVYSIFFSDVIPVPELLPEVKRVLKPAGAYVHFGPLGYHHTAFVDLYSGEELRELFERSGFRMLRESMVPATYLTSARSLYRAWFNNWSFCAEKVSTRPIPG